jgi:hypothetical protein
MPIVRGTDRYDATVYLGFPVIVRGAASARIYADGEETAKPLPAPS